MRRKSSWPSTRPEAISWRAASIIRRASSSRVRSFSASASRAAKTASRSALGAFSAKSLRPASPRAALPATKSFLMSARLMLSPARMLTGWAPVNTLRSVDWDDAAVLRWLEPLVARKGDIVEVFAERLRETTLEWRDGEVLAVRARREEGTSARWRRAGSENLVFVAGASEASAREAVRGLRESAGTSPLPIRSGKGDPGEDEPPPPESDRWTRRLVALFGRHAPKHRVQWRVRQT